MSLTTQKSYIALPNYVHYYVCMYVCMYVCHNIELEPLRKHQSSRNSFCYQISRDARYFTHTAPSVHIRKATGIYRILSLEKANFIYSKIFRF